MYLNDKQKRTLFQTLRAALPGHTLICDLMTERFAVKVAGPSARCCGRWARTSCPSRTTRSSFRCRRVMRRWSGSRSWAGAGARGGHHSGFLFNTILKTLRDGYGIHVFRAP